MKSRALSSLIVALATAVPLSACQKEEGPMERIGKGLDEAASDVGEAAEQARKEVKKAAEGDR